MLQSSQTSTDTGTTSNRREKAVDFLVVGHVTQDLLSNDPQNSEYTLGGTASFAAVTAARLGRHPTVITRAAADTDLSALPPEVTRYVLPSPTTTTFANIYTEHGRIQYCYTPAQPISASDIPPAMHCPKIALLGPVANEVEPDVAAIFAAETLVAAVPQGWMRTWNASGQVHSQPWYHAETILPHLDVIVLSLEDIDGDLSRLEPLIEKVPLVALTEYRDGSTIYRRLDDNSISAIKIPPRPAREVDPTGAGDIYATAFLLRLQETGDPEQAAFYANITASFGVEGKGVSGIPSHQQVMDYMLEQGQVSNGR
jgi:1D-myo-inositol 3-kinase